jgi:lipoprotein-anchoring transpeptidase ErfK/SrfK
MIRPFSALFLGVAAVMMAAPAAAQYYSGPPPGPAYRGAPPPGVYDDDDDQGMYRPPPPGYRGPPPRQGYPYQDQVDVEPLPAPGFVPPSSGPPPGGPPPAVYGHQLDNHQPVPPAASADPEAVRPPGSIGPAAVAPTAPGAQPAPVPPSATAALPPEDRPEVGAPKELPANLRKQLVEYNTREPAGTIIIDTPNTYLYLVLGGGKALRYGIGVGREGFTWAGTERVSKMKEWPDWFPPAEMIERQPYLPRIMAGGPGNPLGARALYLGKTLYRIHGTNQPSTIGSFVSSGCIRLLNEDIEDLYSRVQVGTRVVVLPGANHNPSAAAAPATAVR